MTRPPTALGDGHGQPKMSTIIVKSEISTIMVPGTFFDGFMGIDVKSVTTPRSFVFYLFHFNDLEVHKNVVWFGWL